VADHGEDGRSRIAMGKREVGVLWVAYGVVVRQWRWREYGVGELGCPVEGSSGGGSTS